MLKAAAEKRSSFYSQESDPAMGLVRRTWRKCEDAGTAGSPPSLETADDGQLLSMVMADPPHARALAAVRYFKSSESLRVVAGGCCSLACREAAYERLGDMQHAYLMRWLLAPGLTRAVILGYGPSSEEKRRTERAVAGLSDPAVLRALIAPTEDAAQKVKALEELGAPLPDEQLRTLTADMT